MRALEACSPGQPVADWDRQRELLEEVSRGIAGGSAETARHTMPCRHNSTRASYALLSTSVAALVPDCLPSGMLPAIGRGPAGWLPRAGAG